MKKIVTVFALLSGLIIVPFANVYAEFDFKAYTPTLDSLYAAGLSPQKSGYSLLFEKTDEANAKFVYYQLNADNSITPVYYTYGLTYPVNGAVNSGHIGSTGGAPVNAYFLDNSILPSDKSGGAAVSLSYGEIGDITADFIGNNIDTIQNTTTFSICGGAIFNTYARISSIKGDFIGNYLSLSNNYGSEVRAIAQGGAIYNTQAQIGDISGNFISNSVYSSSQGTNNLGSSYGGAIYNVSDYSSDTASIGNIKGTFMNNSARSKSTDAYGGAIFNHEGTIGNIDGSFFNNFAQVDAQTRYARGGAIYSWGGKFGDITGDFVNNYSIGSESSGGALSLYVAVIGDITGNFIKNYTNTFGGAIENWGEKSIIGKISGSFYYNYAQAQTGVARGGAVYNSNGTIGAITGDFIGNYTKTNEKAEYTLASSEGGAIFNGSPYQNHERLGKIEGIKGNFLNNYAESPKDTAAGGAIYNIAQTIGLIEGNFENNYTKGMSDTKGGAIYNSSKVNQMGGVFRENVIISGIFEGISGDFLNNFTLSESGVSQGGALYNELSATFSDHPLSNGFESNYAQSASGNAYGGAIYNAANQAVKVIIDYDWSTNTFGDPIWKQDADAQSNMTIDTATFLNNYASSDSGNAYGGAIAHISDKSTFQVSANDMGASGETSDATLDEIMQSTLTITNSSFYNNSVTSTSGEAKGGAIYSNNDVNIIADGGRTVFSGNTANGESNAIYMAKKSYDKIILNVMGMGPETTIEVPLQNTLPTLSLFSTGGGIIEMDDEIDGDAGYKIALSGDASGTINFGGLISNASEVVSSDVTVNFNKEQEGLVYNQQSGTANLNAAFNNSSLTVGETVAGISSKAAATTVMNIADGSYLNGNNSLTVNSGMVNIGNLDNNLHFNKLSMTGGSLAIENVGVDLATQVMGSLSADSYDHQDGTIAVKNVNVTADGSEGTTAVNFTDSLIADKVVNQVTEAMGPVYKYDVAYNPSTGEFEFSRPETPGGDDVNPEVMAPVVAAASTVAVLNDEIYSRVLGDVDSLGSSTPHVSSSDRSIKNAWVKTFGSKDSVDLKNFRGADTKFYGFIGGLSSDRINEGQGWSAIYSVYGAYAGGEQKFAGEKVTNNGGYLGFGANFYNGDFFIGTTINGGLIRNRSDKTGVDGKDKFNSYVGGIAGKTGYDYHIGSFTVEPNVYASYTVIGADDYMTKSGVKVDFGTMGVIEAAPGLKLAQEFGEGLKGYVSGRYVWTFTEGDHVKANQFDLPDVELEDYAEYGIGLEKNWHGSSGFVEVKRRDGGRNGWNFTAGYKSAF